MNSMTCSFCANKKRPGPHGHSIRDFTKIDKPITCPELLSIDCGYCHEKGHTVKYCGVLKSKKLSNKTTYSTYIKESRPNKRDTTVDSDGYISYNKNRQKTTPINDLQHAINKAQFNSNLTNCFEVLNMDECDSNSEYDDTDKHEDITNSTWSNIISNHKKKLPEKTKWSDSSDDEDAYYHSN